MNSPTMIASHWPTQADLGGQPGHGPVQPEPEHELFHAAWEPRALALTLAMGATGAWNIDISRAARETLSNYAQLSYYEIWMAGLQRLLIERGLVSDDEVATGQLLQPALALPRRLLAADVPAALARGSATLRASTLPARFVVGDAVRTRSQAVDHHTRLPRYASGKLGHIERLHGMHVQADAHAQGLGEQPEWLYTVVFNGTELWGAQASAGLQVSINAWDSYLEPA